MTLCEVATAKHHSLPLECASYWKALSEKEDILIPLSRSIQGECVDSLARSAQFWSSYSGYLREVPQLCYEFRRGNDIDFARSIYYNITVEKLNLVRFILEKERKSERYTEELRQQAEKIQHVFLETRALSGEFKSTADDIVSHLNDEFNGTFKILRSWARDLFNRRDEATAQSFAVVRKLRGVVYFAHECFKFENALNSQVRRHAQGLDDLLSTIQSAFGYRLDGLLSQQVAAYEHLSSVSTEMERRWLTSTNISMA
ncbi:unnamed protein product [Cyclocybe aegerita]|uniref:Uncharacterized protein n=1 Tax=Cyclocybe aegerita TaxID=1973307 RepID=A0A8S0XIZ1_CYCAE|nr:unnamed protein product [Cyclocybe aegerita]